MKRAATLVELLLTGERHGDRRCFTLVSAADKGAELASISFAEVVSNGKRMATVLQDAGVDRGSRVLIAAGPSPDWISCFVGTVFAGAVAVPVNHRYTKREFASVIDASHPAVAVVDARSRQAMLEAIGERTDTNVLELGVDTDRPAAPSEPIAVRPEELAVILHTSGTTGTPKGVERTHGEYALFTQDWGSYAMDPSDRIMNFLPLYHQAGLVCAFLSGYGMGLPTYQVDRFNRETFWEAVAAHSLTWAVLMQPVPRYLLEMPDAGGPYGLRWVIATMSPEDWVAFQSRFGVSLNSSYGSTEATIVRMTGGRHDGPVDSERIHGPLGGALCGRPYAPWGEARVVDDDGASVPPLTPGVIEVRGETVFKRYFRDPEASATVFTSDGWHRTGDRGYISRSGDLYLLDRLSESIRRSGENISPREIEEVLELHPGVAEAAVIGVADELRGQEIAAFVSLRPEAKTSAEEIFEFCAGHLTQFKVPRYLEFRESLPHTPTFKVRREALSPSEGCVDRTAGGEVRHGPSVGR